MIRDDRYHADSVLIVYPQERFALQAIERFEAYGLSFETIEPCMEERASPRPLEIFKRLPGTNCRDCGEPTCMAFAARLARGEAALAGCPHIYLADYQEKRTALLTLFPGLKAEGGSGAPT